MIIDNKKKCTNNIFSTNWRRQVFYLFLYFCVIFHKTLSNAHKIGYKIFDITQKEMYSNNIYIEIKNNRSNPIIGFFFMIFNDLERSSK